jgi:hypothetical protein
MRDDEEEGTFEKIIRRTFIFIGSVILAVFLVFGLCRLAVGY